MYMWSYITNRSLFECPHSDISPVPNLLGLRGTVLIIRLLYLCTLLHVSSNAKLTETNIQIKLFTKQQKINGAVVSKDVGDMFPHLFS